jgi:hypothetical protein
MSGHDSTTPRPALLADAASDDGRPLPELVESWRASSDEQHAYCETGQLPDPRMDPTDLVGALHATTETVALAPARTLGELSLKAEVAVYWLLDGKGRLTAVEEALAEELNDDRGMLQMVMLSILRDLLRLSSPEQGRLN